jgi:hypothetical protein
MKRRLPAALRFAAVSVPAVSSAESIENRCYMEAAEDPIYIRVFNANDELQRKGGRNGQLL